MAEECHKDPKDVPAFIADLGQGVREVKVGLEALEDQTQVQDCLQVHKLRDFRLILPL